MRLGTRAVLIVILVLASSGGVFLENVSAQLGYPLTIGTVTGDNLRVRGKPAFVGETLTTIDSGIKVDIHEVITRTTVGEGEPNVWLKIKLPDDVDVWVSDLYVDRQNLVVTASELNMRGGPGEEFSVLGRIPRGEKVDVIEIRDSWMKIRNPGYATGYVAANFVDYTVNSSFSGPDTPAVTAPPVTTRVPSRPSSSPSPSSYPEIFAGGSGSTTTSSATTYSGSSASGSGLSGRSLFDDQPAVTSSPVMENTIVATNRSSEVVYDYSSNIITESPSTSTTISTTNSRSRVTSPVSSTEEIGVFYDNPSYEDSITTIPSAGTTTTTTTTYYDEPVQTRTITQYPETVTQSSAGTYSSSPGTAVTVDQGFDYPEIIVDDSSAAYYSSTGGQGEFVDNSSATTVYDDSTYAETATAYDVIPEATAATSPRSREPIVGDSSLRALMEGVDLEKARRVFREGVVRGTISPRAPSEFALINVDNNQVMNFLWSPEFQLQMGKIAGQRVLIEGREYVDSRWPKIPILKIEKIFRPR